MIIIFFFKMNSKEKQTFVIFYEGTSQLLFSEMDL